MGARMKVPGFSNLKLIAQGGMARVYLARQESLARNVAIKVLNKFDKPTDAKRFLNEAHIIAALDHRNIITIHDIGQVKDRHYIAMEYLAGGDLEARIAQGVSVEQALHIVEVMGECLAFVHQQGVIHRDIKPANILFHTDGTPILTDFGIAKQNEVDANLTMDGTAVGSPYYLSPEQAECKPLDGRTDIYGLGVVFYEMLTGKKPFEGSSHMETLVAHITEPVPTLPHGLRGFQPLIDRMLAKQAEDRFADATELVEFVKQLRDDADAAANRRRSQPRRRFRRRTPGAKSKLRRYANIGAMGLILVGMAGYSSIRSFKIESHLHQAMQAQEAQRYFYPEDDNVLYHYRTVLKWDSDNDLAIQGLVETYTRLAEEALSEFRHGKARQYVQAGLELAPDDPQLNKLDANARPFSDAPKRVADGFKQLFGFSE